MFELYYLPDYADCGSVFPRKMLDTYETEKELIDAYAFTIDEIDSLVAGDVVRERFICKVSYEFLQRIREIVINDVANEYPLYNNFKKIGEVIDCTENHSRDTFNHALKKIENGDPKNLINFVMTVAKLHELRESRMAYGKNSF